MQRLLMILSLVCCLPFSMVTSAGESKPAQKESLAAQKLGLDKQRLELDTKRLTFDQQKAERDHSLEERKVFMTAWSIAIPAAIAAFAYLFQVWARRRDEQLQFQLKVAEIVMDVRDSDVAKRKAGFLVQLFPRRLKVLNKGLKTDRFPYFGPSMERREELLRLLAQHPESRGDIIQAWELLFSWSTKQDWFIALKGDPTVNRNKPPPQ